MARRWKARSTTPGDRRFVAGSLEALAPATSVINTATRGDGVVGRWKIDELAANTVEIGTHFGVDGAQVGTSVLAATDVQTIVASLSTQIAVLQTIVSTTGVVIASSSKSGFTLAGVSTSNAPSAAIADADVSATAFKGGTTRLCARVFFNGADIKQADVASIAYSIYQLDKADPDARTAVTGHAAVALDAADVLFDTLQTDAQASNYNFRHVPPIDAAAAFAIAGAIYSVEYTITPTSGQKIIVRFRVQCL